MPSETVIALRKQLREKFPAAHRDLGDAENTLPAKEAPEKPLHPSRSKTPRAATDPCPLSTRRFPPGAITEISPAETSCGLSLIIAALLAEEELPPQATTCDAPPALPLALIDARDRFDPGSFSAEQCARLLWLRCRDTHQALRAADLLLRDGNLPLVVLDLASLPARELRRIPSTSWHRLRQLAESTSTVLLALTPTPLIPRTGLRLTLTHRFHLDDLHLSRRELITALRTETTRHLHHTA